MTKNTIAAWSLTLRSHLNPALCSYIFIVSLLLKSDGFSLWCWYNLEQKCYFPFQTLPGWDESHLASLWNIMYKCQLLNNPPSLTHAYIKVTTVRCPHTEKKTHSFKYISLSLVFRYFTVPQKHYMWAADTDITFLMAFHFPLLWIQLVWVHLFHTVIL